MRQTVSATSYKGKDARFRVEILKIGAPTAYTVNSLLDSNTGFEFELFVPESRQHQSHRYGSGARHDPVCQAAAITDRAVSPGPPFPPWRITKSPSSMALPRLAMPAFRSSPLMARRQPRADKRRLTISGGSSTVGPGHRQFLGMASSRHQRRQRFCRAISAYHGWRGRSLITAAHFPE